MKVKVTKKHIKEGNRNNGQCAVLCAVRDIVPTVVSVGYTVITFFDRKAMYMPRFMRDWIVRWDRGELVSPITFETVDYE